MRFGIREICDVVLKAKAAQRIGNKVFYKNEPVIYFDTLKTSTMEGAATTVYAQGGRGNSRLVAWEGERTLTFTMEDALISPAGFMILSGAGLVEASESNTIKVHATETTNKTSYADGVLTIGLKEKPYYDASKKEDFIYVMLLENGEIISEPYIATYNDGAANEEGLYEITVKTISASVRGTAYDNLTGLDGFENESAVFVDYYVEKNSNKTQQIEITADKFGGNYYLEASTLFRTEEGVDLPAEIIIPNCKIQSNFTFTMASSGDPSTFTFTMDAFPDYTRFDNSKKVLAAIQVIDDAGTLSDAVRQSTDHGNDYSMFD